MEGEGLGSGLSGWLRLGCEEFVFHAKDLGLHPGHSDEVPLLLHCSAVHLTQFKEEFKLEWSRLECGGKAGRPGEWLQKLFCVYV